MGFLGGTFLVVALIIGAVAVVALVFFLKLKRKARQAFGTSDLSEIITAGEFEANNSIKSVNGMDALVRPRMEKDFPKMSVDELKSRDRDEIFAFYKALNTGDASHFEFNKNINDEVSLLAQEYKDVGVQDVKLHRHVISGYENKGKIATVNMQAAVEYKKSQEGKSSSVQTRIYTQWMYMIEKVAFGEGGSTTLNCPNCAAPLQQNDLVCSHCGSDVQVDYNRAWSLNAIGER